MDHKQVNQSREQSAQRPILYWGIDNVVVDSASLEVTGGCGGRKPTGSMRGNC